MGSLDTVNASLRIGADVIAAVDGVSPQSSDKRELSGVIFGEKQPQSAASVSDILSHRVLCVRVFCEGENLTLRSSYGEVK